MERRVYMERKNSANNVIEACVGNGVERKKNGSCLYYLFEVHDIFDLKSKPSIDK
jgi:hypothetical protein